MPFRVTEFESTPNPNAIKCWLDRPISDHPRSYLNRAMAEESPLARALFDDAGATNVLMNGTWITVCKPPEVDWAPIKRKIQDLLGRAEHSS